MRCSTEQHLRPSTRTAPVCPWIGGQGVQPNGGDRATDSKYGAAIVMPMFRNHLIPDVRGAGP